MVDPSALHIRITDSFPSLTPQERRAAEALLSHLEDVATYRATELAVLAGVSKATISRLVRRLGFDDFEALRQHARQLRNAGVPIATGPTPGLSARVAQDVANLHRLQATLDETTLDAVADQLAGARRVIVSGHRSSYAVASGLRMNLAQIRPDTWLVPQPGQSLADDIIGLGPDDVAIVVSFRRHGARVGELMDALRKSSTPVLLIADGQLRSLATSAKWWIECPSTSAGAFDSHAAAMTLVALISDRLLHRLPDASARIDRVDRTYRDLRDIDDS